MELAKGKRNLFAITSKNKKEQQLSEKAINKRSKQLIPEIKQRRWKSDNVTGRMRENHILEKWTIG